MARLIMSEIKKNSCFNCGKSKSPRAKYCSAACKQEAWRDRHRCNPRRSYRRR